MAEPGVTIKGIDGVRKLFSYVPEVVKNETLYDQIVAVMLNRNRTRFLAETDPNEVPWTPSAGGIARRAGGGSGTLFDTGMLFHSIQAFKPGPLSRGVGTDIPYAKYHQNGTGRMQRIFLGVSEADSVVIEKILITRMDDWAKKQKD